MGGGGGGFFARDGGGGGGAFLLVTPRSVCEAVQLVALDSWLPWLVAGLGGDRSRLWLFVLA